MIKSEQKPRNQKEPYEAPAARVLTVAVERGFAGSGQFETTDPVEGGDEWEE